MQNAFWGQIVLFFILDLVGSSLKCSSFIIGCQVVGRNVLEGEIRPKMDDSSSNYPRKRHWFL